MRRGHEGVQRLNSHGIGSCQTYERDVRACFFFFLRCAARGNAPWVTRNEVFEAVVCDMHAVGRSGAAHNILYAT